MQVRRGLNLELWRHGIRENTLHEKHLVVELLTLLPLDLSEWEKTPPHLRMSYSILKNAGYSPTEVHTKKEIAELRAMIENESDREKKIRLINKLNALSITDSMQMERLLKK